MIKWLKKIKLWKRKNPETIVHDYGQYSLKPMIARALSVVMEISQAEVCAIVADPQTPIYLNDDLLQGIQWARIRLESGQYEIKMPTQHKIWRFFID